MRLSKYTFILLHTVVCSSCSVFQGTDNSPKLQEITKAEYFIAVNNISNEYPTKIAKIITHEYDLIDGNKNNEKSETIFYTGCTSITKVEYETNVRADEIAQYHNEHYMRRSRYMIDEEFIGYNVKFFNCKTGDIAWAIEFSLNNNKETFQYNWNGAIMYYEKTTETSSNSSTVFSYNVERSYQ